MRDAAELVISKGSLGSARPMRAKSSAVTLSSFQSLAGIMRTRCRLATIASTVISPAVLIAPAIASLLSRLTPTTLWEIELYG